MHWRQVFSSLLDSIYHRWKDGDDVEAELGHAFDLQDQSELDDIDLEHYTEGAGDG